MPTVSVAMAACNGERYLQEQLDSLARQQRPPEELVVYDDCSTDSTVGILREFSRNAPFAVKLVEGRETVGYAQAFISAAKRCSGDLLLYCDQDDIWSPSKISLLRRTAAACPEQVLTHDISIFSDDPAKPSFGSYFQHLRQTGYPPAVCMKGCATAVKAEFVRAWGWPAAATRVSHDFWIALLATAFQQRRYIPQSLVAHRLHESNASGWIASENDRVRSTRWSPARRLQQSDHELLIELCIKPWNLDWTKEFVRVLKIPPKQFGNGASGDLLRSLESNKSYHSLPQRILRSLFVSRD